MTGKVFLQALLQGKRAYGTLIVSTSPRWPQVLQNSGLDFVFIDTEHIPIDREKLSWMCQTYAALGLPPIVRIPSPNPDTASQVLDGGAFGIVAPYVETPEQVQELVGAVKLRPLKGQLRDAVLKEQALVGPELKKYLDQFNIESMLIVNIESVPAIENLEAILSVPGLDAVLIGPHDLSTSLGIPEQYQDPKFDRTVREIITRARAHNIAVGIHFWDGIDQELAWAKAGANLVFHSSDISLFASTLQADIATMRDALGDTAPLRHPHTTDKEPVDSVKVSGISI